MNVIDEIERRLTKYPDANYERDSDSITVKPVNHDGFEVRLELHSGRAFTVYFNGWHENFDDEEEALNIFAFGLSSECRLKEYRRGRVPYRWTLESNESGKWIEESTTGLIFFPFWMRREVRLLQNKLLK